MKKLSLLTVMIIVCLGVWGQVGSTTGHGYLHLNGNTDNYSSSQLRFVKWSNANAHIDVMDGNDLYLNYYKGGNIYFGNALSGAPHSVFTNKGQFAINSFNPYPNCNLYVRGNSYLTNILRIGQASSEDNNSPGIVCIINDDFKYDGEYINHYGMGFHKYADQGMPADGRNAYISGYFGVDLFTSGKNRLRIKRNGNVGIGTTTPDFKLDVCGTIRAKEIKVEEFTCSNGSFDGTLATNNITVKANGQTADFVFADDYNLKSLSEVENFIKTNKHLPDIPSAEKMEEQGVNLAEMNKLLLQKVEELTLYQIEKDKEVQELKEENLKLEERLVKIEKVLMNGGNE